MAKQITPSFILFDAAAQAEGQGNSGVFNHPIYVKYVAFETADVSAAGTFDLLNKSGGYNLVPQYEVADDSSPPVEFAIEGYVQGIYVNAIPTGGRIFVYIGRT